MKKLIFLLFLLLPVSAYAQAPEIVPGQVFAFDYNETDLVAFAVVKFERRFDAEPWQNISLGSGKTDGTIRTYTIVPPALVSGAHTVEVRACNKSLCSESLLMAFEAKLVPIPVNNLRIIPSGQ